MFIFVDNELFNQREKDWIGKIVQQRLNGMAGYHQISTFSLYLNRRLRTLWRQEIRNVIVKVRTDMRNDSEFKAEQQLIENRYNEEMNELVERWKAKNLRRSVLEYKKGP